MAIPTPPQDVLEFGKSDAYAKFLEKEELQRREREAEAKRLKEEEAQRRAEEEEEARQRDARISAARSRKEMLKHRHLSFGEDWAWKIGIVSVLMSFVAPFLAAAVWRPAQIPEVGEQPIRSVYAAKYSRYTITIPWESIFDRDVKAWEESVSQADTAREQRRFRNKTLKLAVWLIAPVAALAVLTCMWLQSVRSDLLRAGWSRIDEFGAENHVRKRDEERKRFFERREVNNPWELAIMWLLLLWCVGCGVFAHESTTIHWYHAIGGMILGSGILLVVVLVLAMSWDTIRRIHWAGNHGEIVTWEERVVVIDPLKLSGTI